MLNFKSPVKGARMNNSMLNASVIPTQREKQSMMNTFKMVITEEGETAFAFDPKQYVTKDLTELDIIQLKEVFDVFDFDGNGIITPSDLKISLRKYGFKLNKDTMYEIIGEYDENETGNLTFKDFITIITNRNDKKETKADVRRIFRKYDKTNKGFINYKDLKEKNEELNENIDEDTIKEIVKRTDSNMDGKISFEDFYNVLTRKVYY